MGSLAFAAIVHGAVRASVSVSPFPVVCASLILKPRSCASTFSCAMLVLNGTSFQPFLLEMLTEDTAALYDSMDSYYPDLQASLDDSEELLNRTTEAMNTSISTAAIVQNTLKNSSDNLDAATRDSIRGTLELLDKSLSVLDSTASIRHAGVTMKEAIDKEWDDLDGDTRFLNMDPKAEKVSFTSEENQEPESVPIILRTAEISLDDDDEVLDAETEAASQSPLRRIWIVIVKMWKAFVEIFRNR